MLARQPHRHLSSLLPALGLLPAACGGDEAPSLSDVGGVGGIDQNALDGEIAALPEAGAEVPLGGECPGGGNCPRKDNGACDLGLCLRTPEGLRCALACIDACPQGQTCQAVTAGRTPSVRPTPGRKPRTPPASASPRSDRTCDRLSIPSLGLN